MNKEIKKVLEDMCFNVKEYTEVEFSNGCNFSNVIEVETGYKKYHYIIYFSSGELWVVDINGAIVSRIIAKTKRSMFFQLGFVLGGLN